MTLRHKVTERSVYAMLSVFECRQTGKCTDGWQEFETKQGRPFELAPPHEEGVSALGKPERYYEQGYVEALRDHVLRLVNSYGVSSSGCQHFKVTRTE